MQTMVRRETNVLAFGWLTTAEAARALGLAPKSFRVWLGRHKEVDQRLVGRMLLVRLESVYEARR